MADGPIHSDSLARRRTREGLLAGVGAYLFWGFVAIYFKLLLDRGIEPKSLVAYRVVWSLVFLAVVVTVIGGWGEVAACFRSKRSLLALVGSTLMIGINWYTYVYAVSTRQLSDASLGYYMNPLVNVLLGVVVLRERLRSWQVLAVGLAATGVAYETHAMGRPPWIALSLALSFGTYGLLRKTMRAGAMSGLLVETLLLAPLCIAAIAWLRGNGIAGPVDWPGHALLALSGIITATPLLLFAAAARRLRLSSLGFLQYLSPTIQLLIAILLFGEPFTLSRKITFTFIWAAVLVFTVDQILATRKRPAPADETVTEPT